MHKRRNVEADLLSYAEQRALEIGITIAGGAQVLYAGALQPSAPTALPVSWQVSAPGAAEILAVILSAQPLAVVARPLDVAALRRQPGIFVTELFLPKEESR